MNRTSRAGGHSTRRGDLGSDLTAPQIERRRFLRSIVAIPAVAVSQAATSGGGARLAGSNGATQAAAMAQAPPDSPEISATARALVEVVKARYGQYLEGDDLERVAREIDSAVQGGERLAKAQLSNADEPDYLFRVG